MSTSTRFTIAEYDRMIESGVFADRHDQRLELICGEIREMMPPGPWHESVVDWLNEWSVCNVDLQQVRVRVQNTIGIPAIDSVPLPDVAWVRRKNYRQQRPGAEDVLLIIEVALTTLEYDRGEKLALYARAGICEYWIVNLRERIVEVFREPVGDGYRQSEQFTSGQEIAPLAQPDVRLPIEQLLSA